ncbi:5-methyltetrahydropteroyltriglutamate--homocysteine S-methyltransferase [Listeria costaricensis]|uniref:5-methyltetrahydropteroyltriglutamate-- homocysteine S-methyltransferase n=1 Tax=Listeria costaricensis TaxID=2026604 RepID=UPI000C0877EE|nr:5-methyltetrahydropteroyltriglutamate--homocysteine S-methyltransferase [Listeria costaricensis]
MANVLSSNLGYPRLGEKREWKKALERYWSGQSSADELLAETKQVRLHNLRKQQKAGIDLIPVNDFSLYDHVLDTSVSFGIVPKRFSNENSLDTYFAIARGTKEQVASEMTKWYNTNYHYIVPELEGASPKLVDNRALRYYLEAKEELGIEGKPVILGPISYLKLGKGYQDFEGLLDRFLPVYEELIEELDEAGVQWLQIDEPYLSTTFPKEELVLFEKVYQRLREKAPHTKFLLQTYFESLDYYDEIVELPVDGVGIDFVHDFGESLEKIKQSGFPVNKYLAAGIIDGRNVWRADLAERLAFVEGLTELVSADRLILQPSSSLLHVPITKQSETNLSELLLNGLSFADEKLTEIHLLTEALNGRKNQEAFEEAKVGREALQHSPERNIASVEAAIKALPELVNERNQPFDERIKLQHAWLKLPLLPTTTIGSFPQSSEVRQKRSAWLKKELSDEAYGAYIEQEIARWIKIQEELGLDVLVHGEFERTDMVEYFGQKLAGFEATKFGWVQSYGSRAVRPPLVYGDVAFVEPITVKESVYAQSLTEKPVKGMLTAPITIINWSFVRDDIPKNQVANQIGLALRQEVEELERNGIRIIQVDEPALREGLPLKKKRWEKYLADAVYSFKLTTTSVQDDTQIHTHMCYSEFDDIIATISALDADVISIETSRSHGEIVSTFEEITYDKEIGLGVYDIHSPRVPTIEEIKGNIERALRVIPIEQFWINPDCGLKTRKEPETIAALKDMVEATIQIRNAYQVTTK